MRFRQPLAAVLCAGLLATPLAAQAQAAGPIVIGQSAPLSGSNQELGQDIRNGALAYFNKVNEAGGVNGRRIELVSLDDANDTKRSEANTRKLLDDGVVALFGYGSATLSRPALPLVEQARITFFAPFTGAEPMRKFNRYVYNHRASYADELEKIVEHYTTIGVRRFAVIHYNDTIGNANLGVVVQALKVRGLAPVAVASLQRTQTDLSKEVAATVKAEPDVVIATTLYKSTAEFVKLSLKQGMHAQFVSTSFAGSTALAQALGKDGHGVVMTQVVPSIARTTVPIVREYQQASDRLLGKKDYSYTALESFIAAKVLVEGIRRAGRDVTRESLLRSLDGLGAIDLGGYIVAFSPTNHNGSNFVALTILGRDLRFRD
ncbi:MAG: ABC transporter substrate-binding protein [Burkholderiales bacterium]|nr:ABC transporter substrate-binding protein [Burkholderiales bacterium]